MVVIHIGSVFFHSVRLHSVIHFHEYFHMFFFRLTTTIEPIAESERKKTQTNKMVFMRLWS